MCEAAVELYKATNDQQYLNDAKGWFNSGTAWGYSWDDQNVGCQVQTDAAYKSFGGFNSSLHSDLLDNVDIRMDTKRKHWTNKNDSSNISAIFMREIILQTIYRMYVNEGTLMYISLIG